eukprot:4786379-Pleurochrysis_carterae.AAC.1
MLRRSSARVRVRDVSHRQRPQVAKGECRAKARRVSRPYAQLQVARCSTQDIGVSAMCHQGRALRAGAQSTLRH